MVTRARHLQVGLAVWQVALSLGCASAASRAVFSTQPVAHNFRLIVWNDGPRSAELEVTVDGKPILSERVDPVHAAPAIAARRYAELPNGHYMVGVADRSTGHVTESRVRLDGHLNVHVLVEPDGVTIRSNANAKEAYD